MIVDQRGTGDSGRGARALDEYAATARTKLGARRPFLTTAETARDLEDLRVALGVEKLTLLGVSYGTKVAGEYARRFPAHRRAVVLDSPVPVEGSTRSTSCARSARRACCARSASRGSATATVTDPDGTRSPPPPRACSAGAARPARGTPRPREHRAA